MRSRGTGASNSTAWWKSASNWIAIAAVLVSAFVAAPSAWVSMREATKAEDAATKIQVKSDDLKSLAASASRQLGEAKRLADAAVVANTQNLRMANAAALAADELTNLSKTANEQRRALQRSSAAAENLADTARRQTDFAISSYRESSRPKIVVTSSIFELRENSELFAQVSFENLTPTPTTYWTNLRVEIVPVDFTLARPNCPDEKPQSTSIIGRSGNAEVDSNTYIRPELVTEVQAGKQAFLLHGTICYFHDGKLYRTKVCRMGSAERTRDCGWGNAID